jgi:hypothetical protein
VLPGIFSTRYPLHMHGSSMRIRRERRMVPRCIVRAGLAVVIVGFIAAVSGIQGVAIAVLVAAAFVGLLAGWMVLGMATAGMNSQGIAFIHFHEQRMHHDARGRASHARSRHPNCHLPPARVCRALRRRLRVALCGRSALIQEVPGPAQLSYCRLASAAASYRLDATPPCPPGTPSATAFPAARLSHPFSKASTVIVISSVNTRPLSAFTSGPFHFEGHPLVKL